MAESLDRRPRGRDSDRTRESLLAAGQTLFAERGFDGARVDQIARRARVNKAMISYHFGGKKGLYNAIIAGSFPSLEVRLGSLPRTLPPPRLLAEFIAIFGELHALQPALCSMILRELLVGGRHIDDRVAGYFVGVLGRLGEILAAGARDGSLRPVDPFLTHLSLTGALVHFFATTAFRERLLADCKLPSPAPTAERYVRHLQDLFVLGLSAPRSPRSRPRKER